MGREVRRVPIDFAWPVGKTWTGFILPEAAEPPTGDGWQLWETVSQGSPISPVFDSAEGLAGWMSSPAYTWGASSPMQYDSALRFVNNGWAPSFVASAATGVMPGEQWVGETK